MNNPQEIFWFAFQRKVSAKYAQDSLQTITNEDKSRPVIGMRQLFSKIIR